MSTVEHRKSVEGLTRRERNILSRLRTHQTYAQIGESLFVSENTVKSHVAHIYAKLGAHNRDDAVVTARELGLFDSHDHNGQGVHDWIELGDLEDDLLVHDAVWARAANGALQARERARERLCIALDDATSVDAVARLMARDLASLVGADYSCVGLVCGDVIRLTHHDFLRDDIAARYGTLPIDDSSPIGMAVRSGKPVTGSVNEELARYPRVIDDIINAGLVTFVAVPIPAHGVICVAWTHERVAPIDDTLCTLAEVSRACGRALTRTAHRSLSPRDSPTRAAYVRCF